MLHERFAIRTFLSAMGERGFKPTRWMFEEGHENIRRSETSEIIEHILSVEISTIMFRSDDGIKCEVTFIPTGDIRGMVADYGWNGTHGGQVAINAIQESMILSNMGG
jgi:hypothetical protein